MQNATIPLDDRILDKVRALCEPLDAASRDGFDLPRAGTWIVLPLAEQEEVVLKVSTPRPPEVEEVEKVYAAIRRETRKRIMAAHTACSSSVVLDPAEFVRVVADRQRRVEEARLRATQRRIADAQASLTGGYRVMTENIGPIIRVSQVATPREHRPATRRVTRSTATRGDPSRDESDPEHVGARAGGPR
jgi:hypothetical protein